MTIEVGQRYKALYARGYMMSLPGGPGRGASFDVPVDAEFEIVQVNYASVQAKYLGTLKRYSFEAYEPTFNIKLNSVREMPDWLEKTADPDPNAPKPRGLGEVPEGMISPEDPRLAWLWEDAAKVANMSNHCGEYDKICDKLGIPGREREFKIKKEVNGFEVAKRFKARSKAQAEKMFDAELSSALT